MSINTFERTAQLSRELETASSNNPSVFIPTADRPVREIASQQDNATINGFMRNLGNIIEPYLNEQRRGNRTLIARNPFRARPDHPFFGRMSNAIQVAARQRTPR